MSPVSVEHDDQYRRDLGRLHEALDAERCAIDEFGVELEGTGAALARTEEAIERVSARGMLVSRTRSRAVGPDPGSRWMRLSGG